MNLKKIFPKTIFVIGCGGGGSRVANDVLVPFIFEAYHKGMISEIFGPGAPKIILVDHDVVEVRNCYRQNFLPYEAGLMKVEALHGRLRQLINTFPIPEAINTYTLPLIFTQELLNEPFAVISNLDLAIPTSQVYNYVMRNAPSTTSWTWFYGGTNTTVQKIEGVFRDVEVSFKTPYVTNYMYGKVDGQSIIPEPTDPRFVGVEDRPLPPHYQHSDILPNTHGVVGVQSNGGGCGLSEGDVVEQVSAGNQLMTTFTGLMLNQFYFHGLIQPEITFINGQSSTTLPYTLEEVLEPTANPGLVEALGVEVEEEEEDPSSDSELSEIEEQQQEQLA